MPTVIKVQGKAKGGGKIPANIKPSPEWGSSYSQKSGFTVVVANKVSAFVFLDERIFGDSELLKKPSTIGRVVGRVPKIDWKVEAEPIGDGQLGLSIYNERGKALLAGTCKVTAKGLVARLATLYPGITNKCKQTAKVKVTYKTEGGTTVEGEYGIEYEQ
ncbi:MAG: hypothetical protein CV087_14945 [Candidatus Brocadia sp. WS118]|nr:MAG: hypothetical protein CV087_14945 [Candidatus Brocadia sp. WS118]